jgi:hypothetical protein
MRLVARILNNRRWERKTLTEDVQKLPPEGTRLKQRPESGPSSVHNPCNPGHISRGQTHFHVRAVSEKNIHR